ncbi:MAG: Mov34/MPN/PAD-1 family protein [Steroidobacteraceae bacterium]
MTVPVLHDFGRVLAPEEPLLCARAEELLLAIRDNKDFELQSVRRLEGDNLRADIFNVICTCEGVPNRNPFGVLHCEPLAIAVVPDNRSLPEVYPLRQDFPATGHQNNAPVGDPTTLCLYDQRPRAVLRTWTVASFLRRIQWWLEETAHGRLHRVDQPLEQVFFESPHEVVLPPGYLSSDRATDALVIEGIVRRQPRNASHSYTVFLAPEGGETGKHGVYIADLILPSITSSVIEREPTTLGALEDQLLARGARVIEQLNVQIRNHVGTGLESDNHEPATLLLLRIPTRRTPEGPIEFTQARAFWIDANLLDIGEKTGALVRVKPDLRYYVDHTPAAPNTVAWREVALIPLSVLKRPTREAAQSMSGVTDPGPRGVIAGAGALGGTLVDLWRRCGWGSWHVIDPDHMRPHNLIRHVADEIGMPKAEALARRDQNLWREGEKHLQPIVGDASATDDATILEVLKQAELLIDASTALDVPRTWAVTDTLKRVASTFLSPSGADAVLFAEDSARAIRIDALEAQYLRAVLNQAWGEEHLAAKATTFRAGTSCRDFSLIMPFSAILAHAATLAEQIQLLPDSSLLRVWQRHRSTGAVDVHTVPIAPTRVTTRGPFTIVWDEALLQKVKVLRAQVLPHETGGVLVGYHDLAAGRIYVVDALAAPPDSIGTTGGFERGVKGLEKHLEDIRRRTVGQVGYLGEWHSHPDGIAARPSGDDLWQLLYLGKLLQRENLPALQFIVGNDEHEWLLIQ